MQDNEKINLEDLQKLGKEFYENKPWFYGVSVGVGLVGLLGTGLVAGVIGAAGVGFLVKNDEKKGKDV